ncbi:MAG: alpha/beta hydrolase [Verrucomicrobia bacterium]|nr:alpha/beta hydrolase [Verrucomicrobiota bacterium]MCF7708812.1 alpha/beta hydrolase [Verrucomicrobiota bacterium]
MKAIIAFLIVGAVGLSVYGGQLDSLRLWEGAAPGALGEEDKDVPTLTPYLPDPDKATGAAMLICPGGGYAALAEHEGKGYAQWLAGHGVAGLVLKYRLGSNGYRHPVMLKDVTRAMRLAKYKAGDWGIDPERIGVMGSSAGGHLASTLLTHFDSGHPDAEDPVERESSRPALGVLCYAVITMGENTHKGSRYNLLGSEPDASLIKELSNELQVTSETPPVFIWHTYKDGAVKVENSLDFAYALRKAGVPFALHVYEKGGHGMGLGGGHPWAGDCLFWLKEHGFVE